VHYAPETSSIVWKIKQFGGGKEFLMRAELGLPSVRGDDEKGGGMMGGFGGSMGGVGGAGGKAKRPIGVKFEIPYFTTSGIQVRYLKIIEPKVCLTRIFAKLEDVGTDLLSSYNTLPCLGCDTSPRVEILLCVCQMCSNRMDELAATNCYTFYLMLSMAMAYWRVGESLASTAEGVTIVCQMPRLQKHVSRLHVLQTRSVHLLMVTKTIFVHHRHVNLTFILSAVAVKLHMVVYYACQIAEQCFHMDYVYGMNIFCPTKRSCVLTCNPLVFAFWT
jgi:hypothetical protein